ncbi:uncharacterized protein [Petaurus breviceps papuanus]|uniref:uncharacterized protein n=1 Tax=Petaurus breviceps papuanus TaxID=3040969 RepID=UPI0036DC0933
MACRESAASSLALEGTWHSFPTQPTENKSYNLAPGAAESRKGRGTAKGGGERWRGGGVRVGEEELGREAGKGALCPPARLPQLFPGRAGPGWAGPWALPTPAVHQSISSADERHRRLRRARQERPEGKQARGPQSGGDGRDPRPHPRPRGGGQEGPDLTRKSPSREGPRRHPSSSSSSSRRNLHQSSSRPWQHHHSNRKIQLEGRQPEAKAELCSSSPSDRKADHYAEEQGVPERSGQAEDKGRVFSLKGMCHRFFRGQGSTMRGREEAGRLWLPIRRSSHPCWD